MAWNGRGMGYKLYSPTPKFGVQINPRLLRPSVRSQLLRYNKLGQRDQSDSYMEVSGGGSDDQRSDGSRRPTRATRSLRERVATSCGECRRRKQKCSQGQPCSNCARRFPPPVCEYRVANSNRARQLSTATSESPSIPALQGLQIPTLGYDRIPCLNPDNNKTASGSSTPEQASWWGVSLTTSFPGSSTVSGQGAAWSDAWTSHEQAQAASSWSSIPVQASGSTQAQNTSGLLDFTQLVSNFFLGDAGASTLLVGLSWESSAQNLLSGLFDARQAAELPVAPTKLNQELMHVFVNLLSRFKASLDGNPDPTNPYIKHFVPWCISKPLMAHVALYTSACFLCETRVLDNTVTVSLKGQAIGMLNEQLRSSAPASDEVIAAVVQLILDEWYWGESSDLRAHLRGLKEMIKIRGGFGGLGLNGILGKLAFSADRAISISLESTPFLSGSSSFSILESTAVPFRIPHNTPLLPGTITFATCAEPLGIHPTTASILDDVRFLITTVLRLPESPSEQEKQKLKTTTLWIHNRIDALSVSPSGSPITARPPSSVAGPATGFGASSSSGSGSRSAEKQPIPQHQHQPEESQQDALHQAIRLAALIYTTSILHRKPLSQACSEAQFLKLWDMAWRVPLGTWKAVLGVFLWIVCAVVPRAVGTGRARVVKSLLTIVCVHLGVENWEVAEGAMERMGELERWLGGGEDSGKDEKGG